MQVFVLGFSNASNNITMEPLRSEPQKSEIKGVPKSMDEIYSIE